MAILGASALGNLLLKEQLITEEQLLEALKEQKIKGKRLSSILIKLGFVSEDALTAVLSSQFNIPAVKLTQQRIDKSLLRTVSYETAKRYQLMPIAKQGDTISIAMADPSDTFAIDHVKFLTGMKVGVVIASESEIETVIESYYKGKPTKRSGAADSAAELPPPPSSESLLKKEKSFVTDPDFDPLQDTSESYASEQLQVDNLEEVVGSALDEVTIVDDKKDRDEDAMRAGDAPIVKLANNIFYEAIRARASDIHIEPAEQLLQVRYRVDGILHSVLKLPVKIKNALTSRIKILSHLDISERRLPQDGRFKLKFGKGREIDFRVSTLPAIFGEKVVMRILDKANLKLDLDNIGMEESAYKHFLNSLDKPFGMILVTGPTGSGKTTTLYSALNRLNDPKINIMTAEDPVEYNFFGINQVQVREEIGLTFAAALRSFLRQDPDIIMVGEIRDFETAEIAVKAALTGHLVLSTLHTNDASGAVTRLVNMGIEPFLISSSLLLVIAQRLARRICPDCKKPHNVSHDTLLKLGFPLELAENATCYVGAGCPSCANTGYRGRLAIYEVMPILDELKDMVLQGASAHEIKREAVRFGMLTLRQSGIRKVLEGLTSIDELVRVTFED
ncbi:MAG TPA: type IV-A pilus assembly ATPase PilB [Dissulfurispiraceae bacterium]|nr:type IV-A pilus assembly ATPase PilB [Dissulfurispiraceae bacterium]